MNTPNQLNQPKNPYQAQKPPAPKPKAPLWADKPSLGEKYEVPEETKQSLAFDSTTASKDYNKAWNTWLQPKVPTEQIEFQPQPIQAEASQPETSKVVTPREIRQTLHNAEIKTVLLAADVLDTLQKRNKVNKEGFAGEGRMAINPESENVQKVFESEIAAPPPEDPTKRYLFERNEPVQEFKQEINLNRPERLVDFGFFFTWMFGALRTPLGGLLKPFRSGFKSFGGSMNNLGKKEVFFGSQAPKTQEQQETEAKQNQNKATFFANLKNQMSMFIGLDRRRSQKQQIEQINKQAGFTNASYEGATDTNGQIRENVQLQAEMGSSQQNAEQLRQDKQRKLAFMSNGKSKTGPGISFSSDKSHNFNNAAKLSG